MLNPETNLHVAQGGSITIVNLPPGKAPVEIRSKWIGLELPIAPADMHKAYMASLLSVPKLYLGIFKAHFCLAQPAANLWKSTKLFGRLRQSNTAETARNEVNHKLYDSLLGVPVSTRIRNEHYLVDKTPAPILSRLERLYDRMFRLMVMLRCMLVFT